MQPLVYYSFKNIFHIFYDYILQGFQKLYIFAARFDKETLSNGVTVALQILVLPV